MKILAGASVAKVQGTLDEIRWLDEFTTFTTYVYVAGKKRPVNNHMMAFEQFPVGLLPMVAKHAASAGVTIEVEDTRSPAPSKNPDADLSWLHDFQRKAVARCLKHTRGIVSSPTGSGKGEMITACAWAGNCTWLVMVHRSHLVADLRQRFELRTGESTGSIDSASGVTTARVTFATFSAINAALASEHAAEVREMLSKVQGVIVDEAHTVAADTFSSVMRSCTGTYYRLGFSGTPFDRLDERSIAVVAQIGPKVFGIPMSLLVERGFIPKAEIKMVWCEQKGSKARNYTKLYAGHVVNSKVRNGLAVDIMRSAQKPAIAFVKLKRHGVALAKMACAAGINAEFVDGSVPESRRMVAVDSLRRGALDLLISTVIFQEGLNVPEIRSVVNLAAGKSTIEILQRIGRGMRKDGDDDDTFEVWDIFDAIATGGGRNLHPRFGPKQWLVSHAVARATAMHRQGHKVRIVTLGTSGAEAEIVFNPDDYDHIP